MLHHERVQPRPVALLEGPALLSPQMGEVKLPFDFTSLPMTVKASGEGSAGDNTSVRSVYMRSLWLWLPRSSQGGHHDLFFSRGREPHPWPGFWAFS
eukprot:4212586-Amphidinium_carterae.1